MKRRQTGQSLDIETIIESWLLLKELYYCWMEFIGVLVFDGIS